MVKQRSQSILSRNKLGIEMSVLTQRWRMLCSDKIASHKSPLVYQSVLILSPADANIKQTTNTSKERTFSTGHMRNREKVPNCIAPAHSFVSARSQECMSAMNSGGMQ